MLVPGVHRRGQSVLPMVRQLRVRVPFQLAGALISG